MSAPPPPRFPRVPPPPPPTLPSSPMISRPPPPLPPLSPNHKGSGNKDGLIRMLLQSATPTSLLPTNPLPSPLVTPPTVRSTLRYPSPGPSSGIRLLSPPTVVPLSQSPSTFSLTPPSLLTHSPGPVDSEPPAVSTEETKSANYIHQLSGFEREISLVMLDHSYAKPWNWKPDVVCNTRPTKTLFVSRVSRNQIASLVPAGLDDGFVDVVSEAPQQSRPVELEKAQQSMGECERHCNFANPDVVPLDEATEWEEKISREGWTPPQHRLFSKTMKVLHSDRLTRLALHETVNETIQGRLAVDKTAKRMRQILAGVFWDGKMTQWLHNTLCDNLPREYLAAYFDVLQTLKAKIPALIDKMVAGRICHEKYAGITKEGLRVLLKRKWDPAASTINDQKIKKLPGNPILILTPSGPSDIWHSGTTRTRHWSSMFSQLGKLVTLTMPPVERSQQLPPMNDEEAMDADAAVNLPPSTTKVATFLHKLVEMVLSKAREVRRAHGSERPIILIGWGVGAAVNCHVASVEPSSVDALVCMGFPMYTLDGMRGEADDPVLELKMPILFVIGQNATQSRPDDIEDMREKIRGETGLVVVGGADDLLRVCKHKKKSEALTQGMVDRCIMDDIREFLHTSLCSPPPTFMMPTFPGVSTESTPTSRKSGVPSSKRRKGSVNADGTPVVKRRQTKKSKTAITPTKVSPQVLPGILASSTPIPPASLAATSTTSMVPPGMSRPSMTPPSQPIHIDTSHSIVDSSAPRAKKSLDMSSGSEIKNDQSTSNLMANSPLLSSALTSPTKSTTVAPLTQLAAPPPLSSAAPLHGHTPIVLPTTPSLPIPSTLIQHPVPMPTIPNLSTMLPHPPPPRMVSSLEQQTTQSKQLPQQPQPPRFAPRVAAPLPPPPRMNIPSSSAAPSPQPTFPDAPTPRPPPPASTVVSSPSTPCPIVVPSTKITIPATGPVATARKSLPGTPMVTTTTKENLYIVAVPPEHLKNLDTRNILQYSGGQMLLVNDKGKPGSGESPVEKRNVAEILASLSGLVPEPLKKTSDSKESGKTILVTATKSEPPKSAGSVSPIVAVKSTPPPAVAVKSSPPTPLSLVSSSSTSRPSSSPSILSAPGGSGRVVRVLQAGTSRTPSPGQKQQLQQQPLSSSPMPAGMRSRKQVFVTASELSEIESTKAAEEAAKEKATVIVREDDDDKEDSAKDKVRDTGGKEEVDNVDQDILEEDLDDLEYIPYSKRKQPKQLKGKGRPCGKSK